MILMDYIKEQSSLIEHALEDYREVVAPLAEKISARGTDGIVIIASGTSKNASYAASCFMEKLLQIPVRVFASSKEIYCVTDKTTFLYVSQGGCSTNTIAAIKRNESLSDFSVSITGNKKGKTNDMCEAYLEIPCGEENVGPKTKGYTLTVLLLYILSLEIGRKNGTVSESEAEKIYSVLSTVPKSMNENVENSIAWCQRNIDGLSRMKCAYIAGKGLCEFIAYEGALKIMETLLIPSSGYEIEEYMHGPSCSLSDVVSGFYMLPSRDDKDYARILSLAGYHRNISSDVFVFSDSFSEDGRDLVLKTSGEWYTAPFEFIIPYQVVSDIIPEHLGIEGEGSKHFAALDRILGVKDRK